MLKRSYFLLLGLAARLVICQSAFSAEAAWGEPVQTLSLQSDNLLVLLRDNALSPGLLSGLDSLICRKDAPDFDALR